MSEKEAGLAERLEDMARSTAGGVNTQEITALLREAAAALASRAADIDLLRKAAERRSVVEPSLETQRARLRELDTLAMGGPR